MVGGKKTQHTVKANIKDFSKNALSATNRAIATTISTYSPFISASLMNASTAAFDVSRFAKENNPLTRNKNRDPYVRRAINRASEAFQTSLNELRQGQLSFEETRNEISEYVSENSDSEWDSMAASADGEAGGAGGGSQKQFSTSDYVKGVAASSRSNVRALQVASNKITESQYKSLNLATSKIVSANMANMQAITRQFSVTNSRIENVNANLVNLVQFNNTTVSEFYSTATEHMGKIENYMEELLAYKRLENEKRVNQYSNTGSKYRSQRQQEDAKDFLSYGFDPGKYARSIIDNLMETAFGPTVLAGVASGIKGIFGKVPAMLADYAAGSLGDLIQQINPIQIAVDKFMPSLKGFATVDDIVRTTITSFFTQLGSGTYDGPFSEIARLFGIKGSTAKLGRGDYNHGEATWTGEDSRALKQVIPEYLSTIELKVTNMVDQSIINANAIIDAIRGVQSTIVLTSKKDISKNVPKIDGVLKSAANSRRLYDYEAGDFTTENKIIDKLRSTLQRTTSMHYDESKQIMQQLLQYADSGKMNDNSTRKAISDALTAIFMNFNATDGETAVSRKEKTDLERALKNAGVDLSNETIRSIYATFINKTNELRYSANRDVGQEFMKMRNLGLGAGTNDISTDINDNNVAVIESFKNVFTLDSILRTLDDELDNFDSFKKTDAYKSMDADTKKAYEKAVKQRDKAASRQGLMAMLLDPSALVNNPFNVVAGTVVNSTTAVALSLNNVVSGVSSFSDEIRNVTQTIREAIASIKGIVTGNNGGINGHLSGATDIDSDQIVKVHKGEIILDPKLSDRVRNGIADFINGDIDERKFNKITNSELNTNQAEEIKYLKKALASAGKIKIKTLSDVPQQIWDAEKYIEGTNSPLERIELLLAQLNYNTKVGLMADNLSALGESDRDNASDINDKRDRKLQALHRGIGKLNKDNLYEGGVLSDFANSVKGTYDKVINSLVGKAYNTYEEVNGEKVVVHHGKNQESFLNKYKNWLVKRAESVADVLGIKGKHKENISKTFDYIGENGHKLILGGLAGMVANCVLPVSIGPVLGVGAALIGSSKTLNERLFGTKDEETGIRRDDGLISTKVTNFVKENIFSLISGGILGMKIMKSGAVSKVLGAGANKFVNGILSIIPSGGGLIGQVMQGAVGMAFGPVGGALLGMGVAAMTQSEAVKKFLFGEKDDTTGKRSGGVLGTIKNSFANLGDAIKTKIFGKDVEYIDENGRKVKRKDGSGILNRIESAVYAHMLRPITTSAKYIGEYFKLWFKDDVLNTTQRIIFPLLDGVDKLADSIRNNLGDMLHRQAHSIKKAFEPVTKAITGISSKLARATLTGVEKIIKLSLKSVSAPINIMAALLGRTKLGRPSKEGQRFINFGNLGSKVLMTGENFRLFFDELFGGKNQSINLRATKKGKNGVRKGVGILDKFEKFLDTTEGIFKGVRTVRDFFKGLENSPVISAITTPLKTVLNVFTHPVSVILKNVAEGVMDGFKALLTAPVKILTAPFKGLKWLGSKTIGKIFGDEGKLGNAIANFKERASALKNNGSIDPNASATNKQFASTVTALGKATTARANANGLISKAQQGMVNANNQHKKYQNDKKMLERQHKRDKALDSYIAKLNIQMSPAEFDALPAAKRNEIIRKLARKSGNKEIYKWDDEKIRALVTGGRGKVKQLELKNQAQDKATQNVANLPDILGNHTKSIVDKLQDIFDALTGKLNQSNTTTLPNGTVVTTGKAKQNNKSGDMDRFANMLIQRMNTDPAFNNKFPETAAIAGKDKAFVISWLKQTKKSDPNLYKRLDDAIHKKSFKGVSTTLAKSLFTIGKRNISKEDKWAGADAALNAAMQKMGIDPSTIDKKEMGKLRNIASSVATAQPNSQAQIKYMQNLLQRLAALKQNNIVAGINQKKFNAGLKSLGARTRGKISSWFDASINDSSSNFQHDPTTGKMVSTTANGKYNWDDKAQRFVVADKVKDPSTGKWVYTGSHNLTLMGRFKKAIRQGRDGTTDAINPDGSLNVNGMNTLQKLIARGMLGKGWEEKKSKGELNREKEQELTDKLKMLATGSGKVKLMTDIVCKVIRGVAGSMIFLAGIGLFMNHLWPIIGDPIKKILFGDPDNPKDGIFGFVNGLWTDKIKPGISNAFRTGVNWMFGNPDDPKDNGAFGKALDWIKTEGPGLLSKGFEIVGMTIDAIYDTLVSWTTDWLYKWDPFNQHSSTDGESAAKAASAAVITASDGDGYYKDSKTGELIKYTNDDGKVIISKYQDKLKSEGWSYDTLGNEKAKKVYREEIIETQFPTISASENNTNIQGCFTKKQLEKGKANIGNTYLPVMVSSDLKEYTKDSRFIVTGMMNSEGEYEYSLYPMKFDEAKWLWKKSNSPAFTGSRKRYSNGSYSSNVILTTNDVKGWYDDKSQYTYGESFVGYGPGPDAVGYGHFTQNDPRWSRVGYGKFRNGSASTMANGGCGPTAMANAINNVYGRNVTNPVSVANYASRNGYSVGGGTSAGLFSRGAKALGVSSNAISKNASSITNQLRHGKNVIVAGRGGNAYTSAGHIMSVRGIDRRGNAIVDDPMRSKSRHIPMNNLTKGMTHAWSIGKGPDTYYGNSPDGSNYAFMDSYYTPGATLSYYDTTTGQQTTVNGKGASAVMDRGSIIWGYDKDYSAACFVKSIASAVYNLYAKNNNFTKEDTEKFIANLSNSIAQPHTVQRSGKYGANSDGYVTEYSTLANSIYSALDTNSEHGISLDDYRNADAMTQKSIILSNLLSNKPVIIHTNGTTSTGLPATYRSAVFGNWSSGGARDNHAVILDGVVTVDGKKYVMVGDPGSAQASRGEQTGAQIRLVDFDQLTNPLSPNKLNHLLTINDGKDIPKVKVTAPNPEAGVSSTDPSISTTDSSGGSTTGSTTKSKFSSFTDWIAGLVKHVTKVGSALLSAIFTGKSFKQAWAEMEAGSNTITSVPGSYENAQQIADSHNTKKSTAYSSYDVSSGLRWINKPSNIYNAGMYRQYIREDAKSGEKYLYLIDDFVSTLARDILGLAISYIKDTTPRLVDDEYKKWCILAANMLSKVKRMETIVKDYKNGNIIFKESNGLHAFMAMCISKLLLRDSDYKKCASKFQDAAKNLYNLITGTYSTGTANAFNGFYNNLLSAATYAVDTIYDLMHESGELLTADELGEFQTAQVNGYTATAPYTGEWGAPNNQPWVDDPIYLKNQQSINSYVKPETNYDSASSGIANTYQPGYYPSNFRTIQNPNFSKYGRQLTRDLRTFPTIDVATMNHVIQTVAPTSPFTGHGQAFINASNMTGIDPLYIFSQTWESGFGTAGQSHLAKGNYHGLTAYEKSHPRAFTNNGEVSIDSGIIGGAQILSKYYINRDNPHQNNILSLCNADHCYNSETTEYANVNASHLAAAEAAAGFGFGMNDENGVNIHDAMMNTPTSDIYTRDDDIYMGDAKHPMNVQMDTTPTTSRLDVIIELLSELLKSDSSLPPATSKATESAAGFGPGKSKSSNNTIVIANQNKKPDKANTNLKRDGLRNIYDRISKRALTYTQ